MLARFAVQRMVASLGCGLAIALGCGGCAFGPKALEQTHERYNDSVQCVYEEQLLRNIVRMRYNESPAELNVTSIAAQYELSAQAEARPFFIAPNPSNSNVIFRTFTSILPDAVVSGAQRPTISLDPADDNASVREFLTPIPPETLLFLDRTNWPVETVLRLWVERLNGVPNACGASGPPNVSVSDFARFRRTTDLVQSIQNQQLARVCVEERFIPVGSPLPATAITATASLDAAKNGMEYRQQPDGSQWQLGRSERRLVIEATNDAENAPELLELERLLNLQQGRTSYDIVVKGSLDPDPLLHPVPPSASINAVLRSTEQVYFYLANGVEVPCEHLKSGVAAPTTDETGQVIDGREITQGLFDVHVAKGLKPPKCAYAAVTYRGYWYYIDDRDQQSKMTFALMLQLTRLNFGRPLPLRSGPVLTLPAGR